MKQNLDSIYRRICSVLSVHYGAGEASAMAFALLEDCYGESRTNVLLCKERDFSEEEDRELERMLEALAEGVPLQYAVGKALFFGRYFKVTPAVLIPRPETEALVEIVLKEKPRRILDCGTGSGCIAVSIAAELPSAVVEAWDISDAALAVAKENAENCHAQVLFQRRDILEVAAAPFNFESAEGNSVDAEADSEGAEAAEALYDCIVSNPPYICNREAEEMEAHVLKHEPHLALFVPDENPLLFYKALVELGQKRLKKGGLLCVETNRAFTLNTAELFKAFGYTEVEVVKDCFDVPRFVKARKS